MMRNRARRSVFICTALFLCFAAGPLEIQGAKRKGASTTIVSRDMAGLPFDNSAVRVRTVPRSRLEAFRADNAFNYGDRDPAFLSIWDWIKSWIKQRLKDIFSFVDDRVAWKAAEYFFYCLIAASLVIVIVKLIGTDFRWLFFSQKKIKGEPGALIEKIEDVDFNQFIARRLEEGDYRGVVRYLYLKTLQELTARRLILWQMDKTNGEYVNELHDPRLRGGFFELTRIFEYIWYGNFTLNEDVFATVRAMFEGFSRMINKNEKT